MIRKITVIIFAMMLMLPLNTVKADSYPKEETDWKVIFNGSDLSSNYDEDAIREALKGMQPGDSADLEFTLINTYKDAVDWWLGNDAVKSLEDEAKGGASGGAYTYELAYTDPSGNRTVLFTSDTVGGEKASDSDPEGLHGATDATKEYFLLGSIGKGGEGKVTLHIKLDGETQNNGYQDTIAQILFRFAVEIPEKSTFIIPKTGTGGGILDNILNGSSVSLYFLCAVTSFLLMVILGACIYLNGKGGKAR
ncbi:MAG: hypothetical protein IKE38_03630 [Erysipelotrichaceae bacterium]|nr:hypothetical protein [Erysipelotrichaceae bacterium]